MRHAVGFAFLLAIGLAGCQQQSAQEQLDAEKAAYARMKEHTQRAGSYLNAVDEASPDALLKTREEMEKQRQLHQIQIDSEVDRLFNRQEERIREAEEKVRQETGQPPQP